jgi:hypothetical protein
MTEQLNHVCAHTPPTAAQRRAALIADATVLANTTFGRDTIAALQGQWHADDECAELRFTLDGTPWLLAATVRPHATYWALGSCANMLIMQQIVVPPGTPVAVAAARLQEALDELRAHMRGMAAEVQTP